MRIVEKALYGLGGLLAFMLFFVALCRFNPGMAEKIGGVLQVDAHEKNEETPNSGIVSETVNMTFTVGEFPAAANPQTQPRTITTDEIVTKAAATDDEEVKLTVPNKVAGLSGYIPIKATGTEITQTRADEIAASLSKGKTGSSLTFDEGMYIYYVMLNDEQKALYKQIYANSDAQIKNFAPVESITALDLQMAFTAVVNDHPELFWVDTAYKYEYTPKGQVADITLIFNVTANSLDTAKPEFESAAKQIIDETYGYYTDYEKERIVHDALISRVKYDANAPMNQSAYSALVYGRTVCSGYARAFQYVLQQLGIPCYYVTRGVWGIISTGLIRRTSYASLKSTKSLASVEGLHEM